jgi:hypothetical protein
MLDSCLLSGECERLNIAVILRVAGQKVSIFYCSCSGQRERTLLQSFSLSSYEWLLLRTCSNRSMEIDILLNHFTNLVRFNESAFDSTLTVLFRRKYIIVSFATHIARASLIAPMLNSILHQSVKPDEIRLYTGVRRHEFVNKNVRRLLETRTVSLRFVDSKWRSFNKLLPLLCEEWGKANVYVMVVDDDRIYRRELLRDLLRVHGRVGGIVTEMGIQILESAPYKTWPKGGYDEQFPHRTLVMGFQGFLLRADTFKNPAVLALDVAQRLTPSSDDLWWTTHAIVESIKVTTRFSDDHILRNRGRNQVPVPKNSTLYSENLFVKDKWWSNLVQYAKEGFNVDLIARALWRVTSSDVSPS